ncbi:hypothetical protein ACVI1J_006885 [Bradyrhizobium diazoefficiens]
MRAPSSVCCATESSRVSRASSTVETLPDFASEDARSTAALASSRRAAAASIEVWISAMRASS